LAWGEILLRLVQVHSLPPPMLVSRLLSTAPWASPQPERARSTSAPAASLQGRARCLPLSGSCYMAAPVSGPGSMATVEPNTMGATSGCRVPSLMLVPGLGWWGRCRWLEHERCSIKRSSSRMTCKILYRTVIYVVPLEVWGKSW
jgi:hypothetical protein